MKRKFTGKVSEMATCNYCGTMQLPENGLRCHHCSAPLVTPLRIYRRTWQGDWVPLDDIDLSSVVPLPPVRRRRLQKKHLAALVLLTVLPIGMLTYWFWSAKQAHAQQLATADALRRGIGVPLVAQIDAAAQWVSQGRLLVSGSTNLPESTNLAVRILHGDTVLAESFPVAVHAGAFESPIMENRGGVFPPGDYDIQLQARFAAGEQSQEVFERAGPKGNQLSGPLVGPSPDNPFAKQVTFVKGIQLR